MGHNVHMSSYPENVDKKKVQAYWDDYAAKEDWQEGCCGLNANIRWIDHVCKDYEEAEKYIEEHDRGGYDQLAVMYLSYPKSASKALEALSKRVDEAYRKYGELSSKIHYLGAKSQLISCTECGSKISTKFMTERIRTNNCPVCRSDMRPKSTLDRIENLKKAYEKAQADYKAAEKKEHEKQLKHAKKMWLVKIEYHT